MPMNVPFLTNHALKTHEQLLDRARADLFAIHHQDQVLRQRRLLEVDPLLAPLMATPINQLDLGPANAHPFVKEVAEELQARGISWTPNVVYGRDEFFTYDRATTVSIPWYLSPNVPPAINNQRARYDREELLRILRHEFAHALGYAFGIWKMPTVTDLFGPFDQPYPETYEPDPSQAQDYVQYLGQPGPWQNSHYAQRHPDEDWAETFATWVTPGSDWQTRYPIGTKARTKLELVDQLVNQSGALYGQPANRYPGHQVTTYRTITETVQQFLGIPSPGAALQETVALEQRRGQLIASIDLHELYFQSFGQQVQKPDEALAAALAENFGSFASWQLDFTRKARAVASTGAGWVLLLVDKTGLMENVPLFGDAWPPFLSTPLLVCDCFRHAYLQDYGTDPTGYIDGFVRYARWTDASFRYDRATADL